MFISNSTNNNKNLDRMDCSPFRIRNHGLTLSCCLTASIHMIVRITILMGLSQTSRVMAEHTQNSKVRGHHIYQVDTCQRKTTYGEQAGGLNKYAVKTTVEYIRSFKKKKKILSHQYGYQFDQLLQQQKLAKTKQNKEIS